MPSHQAARPLKLWRYLGVFTPEASICVARVRVGPLRDAFWAIWDRAASRLTHGAGPRAGRVVMAPGRVLVSARGARIEIGLDEEPGIETVCASGASYAWTRKQLAVPARVRVELGTRRPARGFELAGLAVVDDTAAYYERHTRWHWSAGIGRARDGRPLAWNLVAGVNDPPTCSERTIWIDGEAHEPPPCAFVADLSAVGDLRFHREAELHRRTNLGLIRSDYRQPLGRFTGRLPGGLELAEGHGVMELHDAWW